MYRKKRREDAINTIYNTRLCVLYLKIQFFRGDITFYLDLDRGCSMTRRLGKRKYKRLLTETTVLHRFWNWLHYLPKHLPGCELFIGCLAAYLWKIMVISTVFPSGNCFRIAYCIAKVFHLACNNKSRVLQRLLRLFYCLITNIHFNSPHFTLSS